ncbi:MAG: M3 family metallopeptidase [Prevotellaceae bacterium]|nr:M3 family metallopeptidase [Prevotellaceae bacterium]
MEQQHNNPFLQKHYDTLFDTAPFQEILFEDYEEAMLEGMRRDDLDTERITSNPDTPTFENTIIPKGDHTLDRVTSVFFNLLNAHTNDAMDSLAQKMQPLLVEHANKALMNKDLWNRIQAVKANPGHDLDAEEQRLMDKVYEGFVRSGALLDDDIKRELGELKKQLGQLSLQFSQNELKETNNFQLHITEESQLEGLPESRREAAAQEAKDQNLTGWLFTLHQPSYGPFVTYVKDRELRRQMYMARNTLCCKDNEYNNLPIVPQIINLRRRIANLLGRKTFADYVLEKRMAENIDRVNRLLNDLLEAYLPVARKEIEEIAEYARQYEGSDFTLMPWDLAYYSHKLKEERYNIDPELLRPYFQLDRVKEGIFGLATRLYDITFDKRTDIQVYHPDVEVFEVKDTDGSLLGILYTDFHPRSSKQSGAWMTTYKEQCIDPDEGNLRPHASITMNFTKPTQDKPALLTLGEIETFLHEFGHALHALFSQVRFESLSCTNVSWDFVELPSQFMENYATEPEFLNSFAQHYETKAPIPAEYIERVQQSRRFMAGYNCLRQVSLGLLDMAYYTLTEDLQEDVFSFERHAMKPATILPVIEGTCMSTQFGHIMNGGYAAGYYSYKWAEVLDADAFDYFRQKGIFNRDIARRFREEILARGNTRPAMELYRKFRGQEPTIDALLQRDGIK